MGGDARMLLWAIGRSNEEALRAALGSGEDPNAAGLRRPLHEACGKGFAGGVRALLEAGADWRGPDGYGFPAIYLAAWGGDAECVRLLLAAGADPKEPGRDGMTALHLAAGAGSEEMVRLLLEAGADARARSEKGESPRELAERFGAEGCAALLAAIEEAKALEAASPPGRGRGSKGI